MLRAEIAKQFRDSLLEIVNIRDKLSFIDTNRYIRNLSVVGVQMWTLAYAFQHLGMSVKKMKRDVQAQDENEYPEFDDENYGYQEYDDEDYYDDDEEAAAEAAKAEEAKANDVKAEPKRVPHERDKNLNDIYLLIREIMYEARSLDQYTIFFHNFLEELEPIVRMVLILTKFKIYPEYKSGCYLDPFKPVQIDLTHFKSHNQTDTKVEPVEFKHRFDPEKIHWSPLTVFFAGV